MAAQERFILLPIATKIPLLNGESSDDITHNQ
jgi:hypothetical protein